MRSRTKEREEQMSVKTKRRYAKTAMEKKSMRKKKKKEKHGGREVEKEWRKREKRRGEKQKEMKQKDERKKVIKEGKWWKKKWKMMREKMWNKKRLKKWGLLDLFSKKKNEERKGFRTDLHQELNNIFHTKRIFSKKKQKQKKNKAQNEEKNVLPTLLEKPHLFEKHQNKTAKRRTGFLWKKNNENEKPKKRVKKKRHLFWR